MKIAASPELKEGLSISANLKLGDSTLILSAADSGSDSATSASAEAQSDSASGTALANAPIPAGTSHWFDVNKALGPVYVQKVGVRYQSSMIWFLLNANLSMVGLTISLDGLAISTPLDAFEPRFHLSGLGINFSKPEVEIGGSFLRTIVQQADGSTEDEFDGSLHVRTENLTLTAIGSYTSIDGHPSLFAYLSLNYPIGGPAFFFVTGLAGGFGYNRTLIPPSAEQVQQFPLVAQAMAGMGVAPDSNSKSVLGSQMESLRDYIPPALDHTFLAVGVAFTSFKLLKGFVLVSADVSSRFVLNVIGLLSYATPAEHDGKPALIQAELGITATFDPSAGFLGVRAILTNNSYVFDPKCHLTGGMAFYSWFDGDHAGEFVLTVGGYHPKFRVPDYYPLVPRLAINWQVSDELSVHGEAYFALTGHALMAGGALSAVWQHDDVRAWFNAAVDFLIQWQPYHYEASIRVEVGASITIWAFGTYTLSASLGADLDIWGPPFAGLLKVKFVFVTVSVSFGAAKEPPKPLNWDEFRNAFLPTEDALLAFNARGGLIRELTDVQMEINADGQEELVSRQGSRHWILNATDFGLSFEGAIPSNQCVSVGVGVSEKETTFGIAPMGIGKVVSTLDLTIEHMVKGEWQNVTEEFTLTPIRKPLPAGLWGNKFPPGINDDPMVANVLTGVAISSPTPPEPKGPPPIHRTELEYESQTRYYNFEFGEMLSQEFALAFPVDGPVTREKIFASFGFETTTYTGNLPANELLAQPKRVNKVEE